MKSKTKRWLWLAALISMLLPVMLIPVSATSVIPIDGKITVSDTQNNATLSSGIVTATASGWWSSKTNTITITNSGINKARITFEYSASGDIGSFSLSPNSGNVDETLEADGTYTITISNTNQLMSTTTARLTLSNFTYTEIIEGTATINYDNTLGSVTVSGSAVDSGTTTGTITGDGVAIAATPVSGATFVAWVNADNNTILSQDATFTLKPYATTMSIRAIFTTPSQTPYFKVGTTLFTDLADAISVANSGNNKTVVVISNGTLPTSATYNVPSGVSLLAPYADSDTSIDSGTAIDDSGNLASTLEYANVAFTGDDVDDGNTTNQSVGGVMEPKTSVTYTLTIPSGTTINVNSGGKMVVGGTLVAGTYTTTGVCGATAGAHSNIQLAGTINVNSGGIISCCGYILGSGTVNVAGGGTVYQPYVMMDHKDGHYVYAAKEESYFPFNRHALLNIQSKIVLNSGSDMYGYIAFYTKEQLSGVLKARFNVTSMHVVGSSNENALYLLNDGKLTMTYDATKTVTVSTSYGGRNNNSMGYYGKVGRTTMEFDGNAALGYISAVITVLTDDYSLSTADSVVPISYNYNIIQKSGVFSVNYDMALLPGATFTVAEGAALTVARGVNFTIYDGLRDYAVRRESVTLDGSNSGSGMWPWYHYPSSANLIAGGFNSTANLIVNGTLNVNGNLGGVVQTDGDTGKIVMGSSAGDSVTTAFGVKLKTIEINVLITKFTIAGSCGKTTRTLDAQVFMGNDTTPTQLEAGKTYMAASSKTNSISSYTYDVYATHDANKATAETKNDLKATVTGTWKERQAAKLMNGLNLVGGPYAYLADAAAAWQSGYSIQMMDNVSDETVEFENGTYINLNGYSVSGAVSAEGTVYGFDSTSDGYGAPKGSLELTSGTVAPYATVDNKHYLSIADGSTYTFHRVAVTVTGVQFLKDAAKNEYIIFRGEYKGAPAPVLTGVGFDFEGEGVIDAFKSVTEADLKLSENIGENKQFMFGFGTSETGITSVAPQMIFNDVTVTGTIKNAVDNILTTETNDVLTFPQVFNNFETLLQAIN